MEPVILPEEPSPCRIPCGNSKVSVGILWSLVYLYVRNEWPIQIEQKNKIYHDIVKTENIPSAIFLPTDYPIFFLTPSHRQPLIERW